MIHLSFDAGQSARFVSPDEVALFNREISLHRNNIYEKKGKGNDFLGWVTLPEEISGQLLKQLQDDAQSIRSQSEVVVVIGIGGSYLGARAVIEALSGAMPFKNAGQSPDPEILYAGHHLDEDYHYALLKYLENKDYSLIVISKSGTTTEPAIAFRLLRKHLEEKYGVPEAAGRIYAITDASRGALKQLADEQKYKSYVIPDDVGGRYSVLTPVGLLPIAVAGYNIETLMAGAVAMAEHLQKEDKLQQNPAAKYAVLRNILYNKGKHIEILATYNPSLLFMIEWWKQLFGESEGKEGKGIFPAGVGFTTDLHSLGQYIQEGRRSIFETVISVGNTRHSLTIPEDSQDLDGLNYIAGKRLSYVNEMASRGTMMAHLEGEVPNLEIRLPAINETTLGELIYFFEMSCALSGYILDVNPFDQPGVEAYKRNMFQLLGKPGA